MRLHCLCGIQKSDGWVLYRDLAKHALTLTGCLHILKTSECKIISSVNNGNLLPPISIAFSRLRLANFFCRGQILLILGFAGHMVSVATASLCHCSTRATRIKD